LAGATREVQARPGAIDHKPNQELVILPAPARSCCSLATSWRHPTSNTSGRARFSVDFRIVNVPNLLAGREASLVDAYCTGTAIRDFINVADKSRFDEDTAAKLSGAPPPDAMLVSGTLDPEHSSGEPA
jgi:hypothetical protein